MHDADAYRLLTTVSLTLANIAASMTLPMLIATVRGVARTIDKKDTLNYSSSYALQLALTNAYKPAIRELLPMPDSSTNLSDWMLKYER